MLSSLKKNKHFFWLFLSALPLAALITMVNWYVFPQAVALAGAIMLACWGAHVFLLTLFLVGLGRKAGLRPLGLIAIGLLEALLSVVLVLYACATSPDQIFVQAWDDPEGPTHVEVFHVGMHDHMATQVFWGTKTSPFASGYHFEDHFRVERMEADHDRLYIHNGVQRETLVVDIRTGGIQLIGR
jgi:hypothetical protein